ncbi:MAG: Minf_1886 family protein [Patescibacteria group bacterium]|nr:Minf_1886 family protein [Patescibacteria group bacterium]
MGKSAQTLAELLSEDPRYKYEAYVFVFDALGYAQQVMGLGEAAESEPSDVEPGDAEPDEESDEPEQHVSGQQLCEAVRQFALDQYGYMTKTVLGSWGLHGTGDIGEVVFNLIRIGKMRKTPRDRREDFENVYDFDNAFRREFRIRPPQ